MQRCVLQRSPCTCGPVATRQRAVLSGTTARAALSTHSGCRSSGTPRAACLGSSAAAGMQALRSVQHRGTAAWRGSRQGGTVVARAGDGPDVKDRLAGAVPYLVPLFDSLRYGKFAMAQVPVIRQILAPLNPLISLYFGFPFSSLIFFFGIYLGIVQNSKFGRFARFNGMQAVLLDILLIFPSLFERVLQPPGSGFGLTIYINVYNTIFYFVLVSVAYAVGSCFAGRVVRLPLVADAADAQVP